MKLHKDQEFKTNPPAVKSSWWVHEFKYTIKLNQNIVRMTKTSEPNKHRKSKLLATEFEQNINRNATQINEIKPQKPKTTQNLQTVKDN